MRACWAPETRVGDLVFGARKQVIVLDGETLFTPLGPADAGPRVYVHGRLTGLGNEALLARTSFTDLFGRFVVLIHREGVLEVHNDRWGSMPFYYAVTERAVYLSNRVKAIVDRGAVPREIDLTALGEAMAFDFPLNDGTLIAGVRSLEGGTCLTVDLSGRPRLEVKRRWSPIEAWRKGRVSFVEARDELVSKFLEGCERSTKDADAVGITLSGGMDSRCLMAGALHLGRSVRSYHMSEPGSRADVYARRMAEICRVPHQAYAAGPELAAEYHRRLRDLVGLHEGMSFEPEAEVSWLRDQVPGSVVVLHGGYAELSKLGDLRRFHVNSRVMRGDPGALAEQLWGRWERAFRIRLQAFAKDLGAELMARTRASFFRKIASIAESDGTLANDEIIQVCYLQEQVKIEKYSGCMWNQRVRTRFPFSYPPYVDLLLRVRTPDRIQQTFQIYVLQQTRPELYRVPDANTGAPADAPELVTFLIRGVAKVRKELFRNRRLGEHSDIMGWMRQVEPPLEDVLLRDVDERIYDRAGLSQLVAEATRNRRVGEAFQSILLLELWREYMGLLPR
jgi:asparagine synthase (glutamine-hydrolysing)